MELYNPTSAAVDVGGPYVDDVAAGGGSPKPIPAGSAPSCRVWLSGHEHRAGQHATVEAVRRSTVFVWSQHDGSTGRVPRSFVQELPPSGEGTCRAAPESGSGHTH